MSSLAERYEAGEHTQVWDELVALGPDVFDERWRPEAELVAAATMQRVAANLALVVVRLTAMGYRFGGRHNHNQRRRTIEDLGLRDSMAAAGRDVSWVDAGDVEEHVMGWAPPGPEVEAGLRKLDDVVGPLPLSFAHLVRGVDRVDLTGSFPDWDPAAYTFAAVGDDDPPAAAFGLVSDPVNFNGIDMINENFHPGPPPDPGGWALRSFSMPIASNHLLSANQAGDFHFLDLPDPVADPVLVGVYRRPGIRLVEYLRVAFAWGGFPGFEFADHVPPQIEVLRRGLLAL